MLREFMIEGQDRYELMQLKPVQTSIPPERYRAREGHFRRSHPGHGQRVLKVFV